MIGTRPLYDNAADARLFVEPVGFRTIISALIRELNVAIPGDRGAGKTTVLRQVQRELRDQDRPVEYVDATAVEDALELSVRIRDVVADRSTSFEGPTMRALRNVMGQPVAAPGAKTRHLLAELEAINTVDPTTILVDASASGSAVYGLFGRMRDTLWQGPHTWAVAIDRGQQSTALAPPADAFFDVVQPLHPFDAQPLLALLHRRAEDDPRELLGDLAAGARGNPRQAIRALIQLQLAEDEGRPFRGHEALERRAQELGTPHAALMKEVLDRGQVSASDTDLQAILGVGRGRLTQILRELLEHGLLVAQRGQGDGPGAPRTYYRLPDTA